ncbi:FecR family protein [Asticcacaulis benevestitus]|uniref:FecR protein domain-containing protein n=1 Tax=Asticcacaulis benevestitus DSM 16100 = ATCC BAA-896 TaxID=1121022 RepID=V4P6S5_9CAUL|nr:FecR domain-containing protein [Asticcacaulis benevestitus]ESQ83781.1 hypothetical protein ABENE_20125 [Asticcacaulis benevestitus DSM 16100 = ATCC BAA-896]
MEAAALWHIRLEDGACDLEAFERWRDADPRRAAAFARIVGTDHELNIVKADIAKHADRRRAEASDLTRRHMISVLLPLAGAALVGAALVAYLKGRAVTAKTRIGDRQSLSLPDGGRLELNTATEVKWHYTTKERTVWLKTGEIALTVPKGVQPCHIHVRGSEVVLDYGRLNIRSDGVSFEVLALEGACNILGPAPGASANRVVKENAPALLRNGERYEIKGVGPVVTKVDDNDRQAAEAWQSDELIFNGETLQAALVEYNRYLQRPIVMKDPSLAGLRLGGRFSTQSPTAFLNALESTFAIHVKEEGGQFNLTR